MKIFFIHPIKGPINGVKVISSLLLDAFSKDYNTCLVDTAQAKDYGDFGKFKLNKIWSIINIVKKLRKINQEDVVYMNFSTKKFSFYRDYFILKTVLKRTKNVTVHIHANGLENKLKFPFLKTLNQTKVITINQLQKKRLQNLSKVYQVENALPDYYTTHIYPTKPTNKRIQFLFISNLSIEKGAMRLKQTVQWIENQQLKANITIAGGILDPYSKEIIEDIKDKSFVTYLGPIHDMHIKMKLFHESDVLLMLSDENYEVFPLIYIEAMMNGCLIVTTPQIISKTFTKENFGFSWTKESIMSIINLLNNQSCKQEIHQSARQFYLNNYTFEDYYIKIKSILVNE